MSPPPTAIREQIGVRPLPAPPFPGPDQFAILAKEIVVDWQLPTEVERTKKK